MARLTKKAFLAIIFKELLLFKEKKPALLGKEYIYIFYSIFKGKRKTYCSKRPKKFIWVMEEM